MQAPSINSGQSAWLVSCTARSGAAARPGRVVTVEQITYSAVAVFLGLVSAGCAWLAIRLGLRRWGRRKALPHRRPLDLAGQTPSPAAEAPKPDGGEEAGPPPPPAFLEAGLVAPHAPGTIIVAARPEAGRGVEVELPLVLRSAGGSDVRDASVVITLPEGVISGAALARMLAVPSQPGAPRIADVSRAGATAVEVRLDQLAPGAVVSVPLPVALPPGGGAHEIVVTAGFAGAAGTTHRYALHLVDLGRAAMGEPPERIAERFRTANPRLGSAWVCIADDAGRLAVVRPPPSA